MRKFYFNFILFACVAALFLSFYTLLSTYSNFFLIVKTIFLIFPITFSFFRRYDLQGWSTWDHQIRCGEGNGCTYYLYNRNDDRILCHISIIRNFESWWYYYIMMYIIEIRIIVTVTVIVVVRIIIGIVIVIRVIIKKCKLRWFLL